MKLGKCKTERADARGGRFFLLPHCVLNSEAFRTASPRAIKVLLGICARHTGFNNGKIALGFRDLAEWLNCHNHAANSEAIGELVVRGLLAVECEYPRAQRLSTEYRLTFMPTQDGPATNDYLHWKLGDAGTVQKRRVGNFGVAMTATGKTVTVATVATGEETSRCDYHNGVDANPPFLSDPPVAIVATHIVQPSEGLSQSPSESPSYTGGPLSAAPDAEELRARVLSVLNDLPRGSQGLLAALASIRPAALSKFLNNSGSLNDQSRIRLTLALPRMAAVGSAKKDARVNDEVTLMVDNA